MRLRSYLRGAAATFAALFAVVLPGATTEMLWARADPAPSAAVRDGKSAATAAASCWQIKQDDPHAADGSYWLLTPAMKTPEQFFCDQSTDGGGWVLVGRGREGWENWPEGKGSRHALVSRERTTASFAAAQLSNETVDALLNGRPVSDLDEGYRVLRAEDSSGSSFQTVDIKPLNMPHWRWMFSSMMPLNFRINGERWTYAVATRGFGHNDGTERVDMRSLKSAKYQVGFAYGNRASISKSGNSASFVHRNGGLVHPYSEVYVRPRVSNDDPGFSQIADSGAAADVRGPVVSSFARATSWGVDGNLNGSVREGDIQVQAFLQVGSTMFVGGNFTGVANAAGEKHTSRGLAAFNAENGEWIPALTFDFDNQVHDLALLPSGKILAVGDFKRVNGERHVGTVALDPATGAIDPSWTLDIANYSRNGVTRVRAVALDSNYVYLAGNFTHLKVDENSRRVRAKNAGRVDLSGRPDRTWNPEINGTVRDIGVDPASNQFFAGGFFSTSRGIRVGAATALSLDAGAAANPAFQFVGSDRRPRKNYQQAVDVAGDRVYFGGSEHNLFGYDTQSMQRMSGMITQYLGGDMQAIAHAPNGVLYTACHCSHFAYENSFTWPDVGTDFTDLTAIRWVGALDAATGKHHDWTPYRLSSKRATGAWALSVTDAGTLWAGGDFTASYTNSWQRQWNGGFALYPASDNVAPAQVESLTATAVDDKSATLTWPAVGDAVSYEILRDDRTIAVTRATSLNVDLGGSNRFFVRAVDEAGNRSASTPVLVVTPGQNPSVENPQPDQPDPNEDHDPSVHDEYVISENSEWAYRWDVASPDPAWKTPGFDDSSWDRGLAPIGYGDPSITTQIDPGTPSTRPVTTYLRHSFEVDDLSNVDGASLRVAADDGAVVYFNGEEIGRIGMSDGPVDHWTRANRSLSFAKARAEYDNNSHPFDIPLDRIRTGENVVAVETHVGYRASRTMSAWAGLALSGRWR